jgi:hypothetical protein
MFFNHPRFVDMAFKSISFHFFVAVICAWHCGSNPVTLATVGNDLKRVVLHKDFFKDLQVERSETSTLCYQHSKRAFRPCR